MVSGRSSLPSEKARRHSSAERSLVGLVLIGLI
jgi:hypothetical protein